MIYEYNNSNLNDGLYFFYASWNSHCNLLIERLNKLSNDFPTLNIYKVNSSKYTNLKRQLKVNKIPSYLLIKNNNINSRRYGNIDSYSLKIWIKDNI